MILYVLACALVILAINLIVLYACFPRKRFNTFYTSLFNYLMVTQLGHFFLALSTNIQEALLANKIAYIGAAFLPLLVFLGVLSVCQVKLSRKIYVLLMTLSVFIFAMACTAGYLPWYYESAEYVVTMGVGNFVAKYGPLHVCFNVMVAFYALACLVVWLYALLRKRSVSLHNLACIALIGVVTALSFFVSRQLGADMLVMPCVYIIIEWILFVLAYRIQRYDLQSLIIDGVKTTNPAAYISITAEFRFVGANEKAFRYFPSLREIRLDSRLNPSDGETGSFLEAIGTFTRTKSSEYYFQNGENYFKCLVRPVSYGAFDKGFLLRIEEDERMKQYNLLLDRYHAQAENLNEKNFHIYCIQEKMVVGIAYIVESRDGNTGGHLKRTSEIVHILVDEMLQDSELNLSDSFCQNVVRAAPMHDVGKIAIDDAILRKPGKFTSEEFVTMRTHAEKGALIIRNLMSDVEFPDLERIARNMANYHHEKWNGSGYPAGLKGDDIPLEARIMALADVYDALVSKRSYKEKFSFAEANDIILASMGSHFDPKLQKYYENCRPKMEAFYLNLGEF